MNWTEDDLRKAQVLVKSPYGMGHPGTFHFRDLSEEVSNGVFEVGGKPAEFVVSEICDGVVQATGGNIAPEGAMVKTFSAYYPEETIRMVREPAAEEVVRVLTEQPPLSPVNAGELVEPRWSRH